MIAAAESNRLAQILLLATGSAIASLADDGATLNNYTAGVLGVNLLAAVPQLSWRDRRGADRQCGQR